MRHAVWFVACLALGCATAEEVGDEGFAGAAGLAGGGGDGGSGLAGGGGDGGGWPTGGTSSGGSSSGGTSSGGTSSGGTSSGGSSSGGTSSGGSSSGGTSSGGTSSGGTSSGGTGGSTSCAATTSCGAPADLGTVSGDSGSGSAQNKASGTKFYKIRVTEDDNSVLGTKLKAKASLSVPSGTDYDLYAYVNTGSDAMPSCASPTKSSQNGTGAAEQVQVSWGEGSIANGGDDGRFVVIEVRHKSGPCDASHEYQLIVAGNS